MNILALDCSFEVLSVSLACPKGEFTFEVDAGQSHSALLIDAIDKVLSIAEFEREQLELLACTEGPGSFTGLRIAFSTLKGLQAALGIPAIAVPTPDCIAYPLKNFPATVLPLLDAKKQRYFSAIYRNGERQGGILDASAEEIAQTVLLDSPVLLDCPAPASAAAAVASATAKGAAGASAAEPVFLTGPAAEKALDEFTRAFAKLSAEKKIPPPPLFLDADCRKGLSKHLLHIIEKYDTLEQGCGHIFAAPLYLRKSDAELSAAESAAADIDDDAGR
jgi:tRNA threonylcarbamoyladenosine biosynthesis protein TsaB